MLIYDARIQQPGSTTTQKGSGMKSVKIIIVVLACLGTANQAAACNLSLSIGKTTDGISRVFSRATDFSIPSSSARALTGHLFKAYERKKSNSQKVVFHNEEAKHWQFRIKGKVLKHAGTVNVYDAESKSGVLIQAYQSGTTSYFRLLYARMPNRASSNITDSDEKIINKMFCGFKSDLLQINSIRKKVINKSR